MGDIFKRVMECICSGVLLSGMPPLASCGTVHGFKCDVCFSCTCYWCVCKCACVCVRVSSFTSSSLPSGGVGILDPCEHEAVDASGAMTPQEREDVTAAAQVGHTRTRTLVDIMCESVTQPLWGIGVMEWAYN